MTESNYHIQFRPSAPLTLGVELEFQLLDRQSLDLTQQAAALLDTVPPGYHDRIKQEFIQSMVEVNTEICAGVREVSDNLTDICRRTEELTASSGCRLHAASLHPFAGYAEQRLTEHPRYGRIMDDLQLVGRRFITQGLHVHVGLPDGETAIRVCDNIRLHLPVLLALTTSSPYYEGLDTGLCSYRAKLFEALPLAGMPDHLSDWQRFQEMAELLFQTGIISEVRDLWWDVRPHPDFGTVEIRICDLPSRFDEILAVVALCQALVASLSRHDTHSDPNMQVLRSNKWQAARYGLAGGFVDPASRRRLTISQAAEELLDYIRPAAGELKSTAYLAPLRRVLKRGTSADRQRRLFLRHHSHRAVIEEIAAEFWS